MVRIDTSGARAVLDALREGFRRAADCTARLRDHLDYLDALDAGAIERDVRQYLPGDVALDATVHATVDGFNGGFHYDGDVGVSVLGMEREYFPPKLRHELHHAGVHRVIADTPCAAAMDADTPEGDALSLTHTLLKEGLAIHYAQGGIGFYEQVPAGADRVAAFRDREREVFTDVEAALADVLDAEDADRRAELRESVAVDPAGVLPPTHYVGARMVETATAHHSVDAVVDCVRRPGRFLVRYQSAARAADAYRFDDALVDRIAAAAPE